MSDPTFGVVLQRTSDDTVPVINADLSVVGLIGPSDDADPSVYPLNVPVLLFSNDSVRTQALGDDGFLKDAVRGVNGQLAPVQRAGIIVVVRTARGTSTDPAIKLQQTMANIMGDGALRTGLYAFLLAPEDLNITPRLLMAPGYTGALANGVDGLVAATQGVGYEPGVTYPLTFSGGGANAIQGSGHAVADENGHIGLNNLFVDTFGAWYTTAPAVTVGGAAPTGDGATPLEVTATIDQLANPICAAFPSVLNQLLAHAVVESAGTSVTNSQAWRETMNSERLIPVHGGVKVTDPKTGTTVIRPFASRVIGIAVRRDYEKGAPFHSWANQPVYDIVGPGQSLTFSIADGANEGQLLLAGNVGIIAKGEIGNDFAIADGGFLFIGTDNTSDDPDWQFYHVTRGRDYLNLAAMRMVRSMLGRNNIDAQSVVALVTSIRLLLRDFKADGHILGYSAEFHGSDNSRAQILLGRLKIRYRAEEPPVLRRVTLMSGRMHEAVDALVQDLESNLNLAA
jgi:phage tail sheath protein FI